MLGKVPRRNTDSRGRVSVAAYPQGETIMTDMGVFRTTMEIESHLARGRMAAVADALVDTGSELTWVPEEVLHSLGIAAEKTKRFVTATGATVEREVGYAIVHAAGESAPDYVVFAKPGDMILLGARSLEGLNLRVDPQAKRLIPVGPFLAGVCDSR
jgi:predicted aspartyl protease